MDQQKVISDRILTTQDTVFTLQTWLGLLENWREAGQAEPDDFLNACRQLKDADLWQWANRAGGHGIRALGEAVRVSEALPEKRYPR